MIDEWICGGERERGISQGFTCWSPRWGQNKDSSGTRGVYVHHGCLNKSVDLGGNTLRNKIWHFTFLMLCKKKGGKAANCLAPLNYFVSTLSRFDSIWSCKVTDSIFNNLHSLDPICLLWPSDYFTQCLCVNSFSGSKKTLSARLCGPVEGQMEVVW